MSGAPLFISYSHKDEQYVRALARRLADAGLAPWYFTESQSAGIGWAQRLRDVIVQASAVLVVISQASNSLDAEYVLSEVMLAQRERKFIVPLKIDQAGGPLDVVLAARNWVNAWDGGDPVPRIIAAIAAQVGSAAPPPAEEFARLDVHPAFVQQASHAFLSLALPSAVALLEPSSLTTLCRLGRDPRSDLAFSGALRFVSRQHARIDARAAADGVTFLLTDERSSHGTFLNEQRIAEPTQLFDGDQIGLGVPRCMLVFSRLEATGAVPEGWDAT